MLSLLPTANRDSFILKNDTLISDALRNDLENEFDFVSSSYEQSMLTVVRNTKSTSTNQDYLLQIGDIMKLGRIKYKVKYIHNPVVK